MTLSRQILLLVVVSLTVLSKSAAQCVADQTVTISATGGCGSAGGKVILGSSEVGVNYSLKDENGTGFGRWVPGTGSSIELPLETTVGSTTNLKVVGAKMTSVSGTGVRFDGSNDYTTITQGINYISGTWEAWISKDNWANHHDDRLFWNGVDFTETNSFYISLHPLGMHFRYGGVADGSNNVLISNKTQSFAPNSWHHLAATWNNVNNVTTLKIFIDGVEESSSTTSYLIPNSFATYFYMGGSPDAVLNNLPIFYGPGVMDDYRIWNTAKSNAEIALNMNNCLSGNEPNLIAFYNFEEGGGNTIHALPNHDYDAVMNNMNLSTAWTTGKDCSEINCTAELSQSVELKVIKPAKPTVSATTKRRCGGGTVSFNTTSGGPYFAWYAGSAESVNDELDLNYQFNSSGSGTSSGNGSASQGSGSNGSTTEGSGSNGSTTEGSGSNGSTTEGSGSNGSTTEGSGSNGSTTEGSDRGSGVSFIEINNGNYTTAALVENTTKYFSVFGVDSVNGMACYNTDGITLIAIVDTLPQARVGSDQVICSGENVSLGYVAINDNTYVWTPSTGLDHNDQASVQASPASDQTYTLTETILSSGCSQSNTVTVTVSSCTSVDHPIPKGQSIMVYPNPSREYAYVSYAVKKEGETAVHLFNSEGRLVYSEKGDKSLGEYQTVLNVKEYPKGIYLLKIINGDTTTMQKIVVE